MPPLPVIVPITLALLLAGCATTGNDPKKGPVASSFRVESIAKTDADMVAEVHQHEALGHLRRLMEKLYRRNPREWRKTDSAGIEGIVARVFDARHNWQFRELDGKRGSDAVMLALNPDFQGDRVLAFIGGLGGMIMASYGNRYEFYMLDEIDPQQLYNSARNVEIAAWKLASARNARGEPLLLSNEAEGPVPNLSFEREFGKLIAQQDTLARIVSEKTNRSVVKVAQNVATAVFLPVGALIVR